MDDRSSEQLALAYQAGDAWALPPLWEKNRKLLSMLAGKFYRRNQELCAARGVELQDLEQELYFAVERAARSYDPGKEYKFSTYLAVSSKVSIAYALHMRTRKEDMLNQCGSLDSPIAGADEDLTLGDMIPDDSAERDFESLEDADYQRDLSESMHRALAMIPEDQRRTLETRYFQGMTASQVAEQRGTTANRIRQIESHGLRSMRTGRPRALLLPFTRYYSGTGLSVWKRYGSVQERHVERLERANLL